MARRAYHVPGVWGDPKSDRLDTGDELQVFGLGRTLLHQENDERSRYEAHGKDDADSVEDTEADLGRDHVLLLLAGVVHRMVDGRDAVARRVSRRRQWRAQYHVVDGVQIGNRSGPGFVVEPNLINKANCESKLNFLVWKNGRLGRPLNWAALFFAFYMFWVT